MSIILSPNRLQRAYLVTQTDPLTIPNSSGTASVVGTNQALFTKVSLQQIIAPIRRPDITGYRTTPYDMAGRQSGTWSFDCSLAGSGTAGTAPDIDPLLVSIFGQAGTVSAGTSVTYSLSDSVDTFCLYHYRQPSSMQQRVGFGCVASDARFVLGNDIAAVSASGTCVWVLDSDNFSTATAAEKGGLASFPTEPSSPTTHGQYAVVGFTGTVTMDSQTIATLKTATIDIKTGSRLIDDTYNSYLPTAAIGDERDVSISFTLDDTNTAAIKDLKAKAKTMTPVNITIQAGLIAGNIWTFNLTGVQLSEPKVNEGNKSVFQVSFDNCMAHGSSLSALDDIQLVIT